jgi:hypothetical protein
VRSLLILTVLCLSVVCAFDIYKFGGRYTQAAWQHTVDEGRYFIDAMQRQIDRAMSG